MSHVLILSQHWEHGAANAGRLLDGACVWGEEELGGELVTQHIDNNCAGLDRLVGRDATILYSH